MSKSDPTRRAVIGGLIGGSVVAVAAWQAKMFFGQAAARVTTLRHPDYDSDLAAHLIEGMKRYPAVLDKVKDGRVVLKPNFVEFHPPRPINTDVRFVHASIEAFYKLGANEVIVAEGPGHMRDTEFLLEASGLDERLRDAGSRFVDLNVDEGRKTALPDNLTGFGHLGLAQTAMTADLLVSLAKMKTHHWAGATLTMKNFFGLVPSAIYGWPKNPLHVAGIPNSIVDIWSVLPPHFGIIDGIVGMEGDGPIMGTAKPMSAIVMGDNLPAVDSTAMRLMGIDPLEVDYTWLAMMRRNATLLQGRITVEGDHIERSDFALIDRVKHVRLQGG